MNNEAILLSGTFGKVRDLTKWYFSLLKDTDPYYQWQVNGHKLNSPAWLAAHLVWAQDFLIIRATGGQGSGIDWLEHYKLGSDGTLHTEKPDMKELITLLKEGYNKATEHLLTITNEKMAMGNSLGFGFGGDTTNRMMIQHCIRHEAMHTGHLSWLCSINGVATV